MKSGHKFLSHLKFGVENYNGKEICGWVPCFFARFHPKFSLFP